jgi:hypothetical protein
MTPTTGHFVHKMMIVVNLSMFLGIFVDANKKATAIVRLRHYS